MPGSGSGLSSGWPFRKRENENEDLRNRYQAEGHDGRAPIPISQDEFEQKLYDAVAADPLTPRALIFERLNRRYVIE
jgi:hypothetical protein